MEVQHLGSGQDIVGYGKFMGRSDLRDVVVDSGVRRLEHSAFRNCRFLTSVYLPYNLESIGSYCFAGCTRLTKISLPGRIMKFEYTAFRDCSSLSQVVVFDKVNPISEDEFDVRFFCLPRNDEYMRWLYLDAAMCYFENGIGMGQYDSLFPRLDKQEDRLAIALFRLEDGFELDEGKRFEYEGTLGAAVESLIRSDNISLLSRIGELHCIPESYLDYYLCIAVKSSSSCAAYLLEYKKNFVHQNPYDFDL